MYENSTIETAVRFGEIPFAEFTKQLITDTFDALTRSNIEQMEAYTTFVQALSQDLTTYINNTRNDISLDELKDFIESLNLPDADEANELVESVTNGYNAVINGTNAPANQSSTPLGPQAGTVQVLANALGPVAQSLVNNVIPQNVTTNSTQVIEATAASNVTEAFGKTFGSALPNYQVLYYAIAAQISNNKYTLLQNMVRMGMMRLVVDSGTIETRITFSTYEQHEDRTENKNRTRAVDKTKDNSRSAFGLNLGILAFGKGKRNVSQNRTVSVNTAKDFHRDVSGSSVQIFGRVQVNFKTDFLPLASTNP